ncbi:MAG: PKD domain-containing protein, partial [Myxococcota bacterium]
MRLRKSLAFLLLLLATTLLTVNCGSSQDTFPPESGCGDGTDDDEDGLVDCDDPDCANAPACQVEHCYNLVDDDMDGSTDCDDDECSGVAVCYQRLEDCVNLVDDDGDGDVDCEDTDCANTSVCLDSGEDCTNGVDDDADGAIDCDDPDCELTSDCAPVAETCDNGKDDDGDGAIDCDDIDCAYSATCLANGEDCTNQLDDDGDGATDCQDTDCAHTKDCLRGGQSCTIACVSNADCGVGLDCYNGRCAENSCSCLECGDGEVCGRGACRATCTTHDDCRDTERCFDGACYSRNSVPNLHPVASAGQDQTVDEGDTVTLDGTASDPDGQVATVQWTQIDGPGVAIDELGMGEAEFVAPTTSTTVALTFEFRVFDNEAGEAADEVTVTVEPVTQAPVADAGERFEAPHDRTVTLSGSATDDGTIVTWQWVSVGGEVAIEDADKPFASFLAPLVTDPRELTFELTVTDDEGLTGTDTVSVLIVPTNSAPEVDAGTDLVVAPGERVNLPGTVSDPNQSDQVVSVSWTQLGDSSVTLQNADQAVASFDAPTDIDCVESLLFELSATDTNGAAGRDTIVVTVVDGGRAVSPPYTEDFEQADGGAYVNEFGWEHGGPQNGPGRAYSGANVWGTMLDAAAQSGKSVLTAVPFDLRNATNPIWSFRMWVLGDNFTDSFHVEVNSGDGWTPVPSAVLPSYQETDNDGDSSWDRQIDPNFTLATVDLSAFAGDFVCTRFIWLTDGSLGNGLGAYIDDVGLHEDDSDPDGDGIIGIRAEQLARATDPFLADTDGDGTDDGAEVNAQTNPLNPAYSSSTDVLGPDFTLNFEGGAGGLAALPGWQWQHGTPTSGPSQAYSGSEVWATNLVGDYATGVPDYVYLPLIDLTNATDPTFSMWLWTRPGLLEHHGSTLEIRTGLNEWTPVQIDIRPYNQNYAGRPVWNNIAALGSDP